MTLSEKVRKCFGAKETRRAVCATLGADTRAAKLTLAFLADACHATETVSRGTVEETYRAIGRREIWLAIQDLLHLTEDDIRQMQEQVAGWGEME